LNVAIVERSAWEYYTVPRLAVGLINRKTGNQLCPCDRLVTGDTTLATLVTQSLGTAWNYCSGVATTAAAITPQADPSLGPHENISRNYYAAHAEIYYF
jgi:hypothetical protein